MKIHLAGDKVTDPDQFEKETLAALNMPSEIVMRHRLPQFVKSRTRLALKELREIFS